MTELLEHVDFWFSKMCSLTLGKLDFVFISFCGYHNSRNVEGEVHIYLFIFKSYNF